MATEAHIQGIARFIVGYGTEEDENWRDYHFDFCGTICYDQTGVPYKVKPKGDSGYSLGILQIDFGAMPTAAKPFIDAFDVWHKATLGSAGLFSTEAFAVNALQSTGKVLVANPANALRKQDVAALSAFALSPDGSDWVNQNIDNALIGSDAQANVKYPGCGHTLVYMARQAENTAAFKNATSAEMTDLIYAMTMKVYNVSQTACTKTFIPFLDTNPSKDELKAWPLQFSDTNSLNTGPTSAFNLTEMWSQFMTAGPGATVPQWLLELAATMDTQALANPRKVSASSGPYLALREVFEASDYFPGFVRALRNGTDYINQTLFDPTTGAIVVNKTSGLIHQGVMARNKVGYVWDTAGNAFQISNGAWT